MWHENFDTSTWYFETQVIVPFDLSNIYFWYGLVVLEGFMSIVFSFIFITAITYFMCCCFYINACCQHFRLICLQLNKKINRNAQQMDENLMGIKKRLCDALKIHVNLIELVVQCCRQSCFALKNLVLTFLNFC